MNLPTIGSGFCKFAALPVVALFAPPAGAVDFAPAVSLELPETSPADIVSADFTGDGFADMAVSLSGEAGGVAAVSILIGDGTGGFPDQFELMAKDRDGLGYAPSGLAAADFNGDTRLDLAVAAGGSGSYDVHVYLGDGAGGFALSTTLTSGGQSPWALIAADFNNDESVDLAVGNSLGSGYGVSVFAGNGDGTFSGVRNVAVTASVRTTAMAAADFDHDGDQDLAIPLMILLNDGNGGFSRGTSIGLSGAVGVATGDLDNDSWSDVAVAGVGTIDVWLNNGDGTFAFDTANPQPAARLTAIGAVDLDQDGNIDVIAADEAVNQVKVFPGDGAGNLGAPRSFATEIQPKAVEHDDWSGDGLADIAAACRNNGNTPVVSILLQRPGDSQPVGSLHFSGANYSVTENANSTLITVMRSGGSFGAISVDYATSDGSATAGSDYTAGTGTLAFAGSEVSRSFSVAMLDDAAFEGDETFAITLFNVTGGAALGSPSTAIVTITDNDAPPGDSNGDGISDADALALGLDPNAIDSDGDGLSDVLEVGGNVNVPLDSDVDGLIDAIEPGASAADAMIASGLRLAGGGTLIISTAPGEMLSQVRASAAADGPAGINFPFGTASYSTSTSVVGGSVTVWLEFSSALPDNLTLYKVDGQGLYTELPPNRWTRTSPETIYITVIDGEPLTDQDGIADGFVRDPLAAGVGVSAGTDSGGGGCVIHAQASEDYTLALLMLFIVWAQSKNALVLFAAAGLRKRRYTPSKRKAP